MEENKKNIDTTVLAIKLTNALHDIIAINKPSSCRL